LKLLIAYIQPDKLGSVKKALYAANINRFTVVDTFGHSDEDGLHESYRGIEIEVDLLKKIKIEIALNDDFVDNAVNAIRQAGKSGQLGDGKIFILPIEQAFRIRSDQSGSEAIG